MTPFISTQLERGSGVIENVIRPIVPSMFETSTFASEPVAEVSVEPLSPPHPPAEINQNDNYTFREQRTGEASVRSSGEKFEQEPVVVSANDSRPARPSLPAVKADWPIPEDRINARFDPPAPPGVNSPVKGTAPRIQPQTSEGRLSETSFAVSGTPISQRVDPSTSSFDSLGVELERLRDRVDHLAFPTFVTEMPERPATPLVPPLVAGPQESRQTPSTPGHSEQSAGILPRQPVPQIHSIENSQSSPTVTVSIGRIEFRNSSRRTETLPVPSSNPQRPASKVMSLEDYLRSRSAGGP